MIEICLLGGLVALTHVNDADAIINIAARALLHDAITNSPEARKWHAVKRGG
jgi:hypothetical protein